MNLATCELMPDTPSFRVSTPLRVIQITERKSLYDCIAAKNPNKEDHYRQSAAPSSMSTETNLLGVDEAAMGRQPDQD